MIITIVSSTNPLETSLLPAVTSSEGFCDWIRESFMTLGTKKNPSLEEAIKIASDNGYVISQSNEA